ncbi:hypothetical protein PTSG_08641 [Salpingoeca rosetta]|uniref:Prefoldin subunit 6 n=1 Tax=Salpingoeca rosetta (strain ATCC 50818 / BSB-021) TaxID=946362 RepID=F2UK94_SALR5|nr:uncharacterized protein PTSG_08641 [Salpingoeca rosetta]EGD77543.1 hypothetical protein PTSG_08641 [Salpingoeca rosetta]|eukprot:XP_004990431.1 hypothetical protein PTSG_08641 [Salpingoeca rosetta]
MASQIEKELREVLDGMQQLQTEKNSLIQTREKLQTQLSENKMVKQELDLVKEGDTVYKLMGPALIKQDSREAQTNVGKRLEYIEAEIKRYEKLMDDNEAKAAKAQEKVLALKSKLDKEREAQSKKQ